LEAKVKHELHPSKLIDIQNGPFPENGRQFTGKYTMPKKKKRF
jgi:hypothetical protein